MACHDRSVAERISERLSTDSLILTPAEDPLGAELWGAYKNAVALACGLVDGLKESIGGDNLKAALVLSGYNEGIGLLGAMGADPKTAFGPAGIGDLYVTATSPRSRNRTLGEKLGAGKSLDQALDEMHMVAEGERVHVFVKYTADNLEAHGVHMFRVENGLETEFIIFDDSQRMAAALGE